MTQASYVLTRRGFELGMVTPDTSPSLPSLEAISQAWKADAPITISHAIDAFIPENTENIKAAHEMMEALLNGAELADCFDKPVVAERLQPDFALVSASFEEHDEQAIEKVYFDVVADDQDTLLAENLWCKASWLSFHDDDASLRFRFSFGMEGYEDVAADPERQVWAGELCERIFPESSLITKNTNILNALSDILGTKPQFVERIVYFNAPNGGAQFHHDVERGHAGVVFAQVSGSTFWLALNKQILMDEIIAFAQCHQVDPELSQLIQQRDSLADYMEENDHQLVEVLIDQNADFIAYLVERGHGYLLNAGDVILIPQRDLDHCVWHSIFTIGDEPGEALSFAVR